MTRILLVEDSDDVLYILRTELELMGYVVDIATDGSAGIDIARRIRPDIIVSDLRMPVFDGFEFIKYIRQHSSLNAVPAIALTGMSTQSEVSRAITSGFTAHLTKPVELDELMHLIEKLTATRVQRKAS